MIIFGVDTSSLFNFDKEKTGILFLGKGVTEGLDDTTLNNDAEFSLSLHFNGSNRNLFVNGVKIYHFKATDSDLSAYPLSLGDISKGFSVSNMKETGQNGYVYDFSVD